MSLEALLALIQTRQLSYVAFYDDESGRYAMRSYGPIKVPLTNEIVEALREHQADLYFYLFTNDSLVCTDPVNHRDRFYVQDVCFEEEYTRCVECTRIRSEAMLSREEWAQIQADGNSIMLDFRKTKEHE